MKHCIGRIKDEPYDVKHKNFTSAIDAWEYVEKRGFEGVLSFKGTSFAERAKFARWCMGNRCKNNSQEYIPK